MKKFNSHSEFQKMLKHYLSGTASPEEIEFVEAYYHHFEKGGNVTDSLTPEDRQHLMIEMKHAVDNKINPKSPMRFLSLPVKISVAASLLLFLTLGGLYIYKAVDRGETYTVSEPGKKGFPPGIDRAILRLADGSQIDLTAAGNGEIINLAGTRINKGSDGQISYEVNDLQEHVAGELVYNTLETPKGGKFQIILPDGTKVWMNAASTLQYPMAFKGKQRMVKLAGEAYFEVASNKDMPFIVSTDNSEVEVLGTYFNVSAYTDELTSKTTLLEGSVSVKSGADLRVISPGQQAVSNGKIKIVRADLDQVMGWKDGFFVFKNEPLENIMRMISRWYNVEIEYRGDVSKKFFGGKISRNRNVLEVFRMLEMTGSVKFELNEKERRITVIP